MKKPSIQRKSKKIAFIELNDGSHFKPTQIVLDESVANYNDIVSLKELYINGEYNVYAISKKGKIKQV